MSTWTASRRVTAVAVAMVAAAGGGAVAASGPQAGKQVQGATTAPLRVISIVPQGVFGTTMSSHGPTLRPDTDDVMRAGFVVPADRGTRTQPLKMRVVYLETSAGACSWSVTGSGLDGPVGPNTVDNVHDGGWQAPGDDDYDGVISVPAGPGVVHKTTFRWPTAAKPGMFVQFALHRHAADPADTCQNVMVVGMELRY